MDFLKQNSKFKIRWQSNNTGDMEIKFGGPAVIFIGNQTYHYHQGKGFNVSKKIYYKEAKKRKFYLNIPISNHENFHSQLKKWSVQ